MCIFANKFYIAIERETENDIQFIIHTLGPLSKKTKTKNDLLPTGYYYYYDLWTTMVCVCVDIHGSDGILETPI